MAEQDFIDRIIGGFQSLRDRPHLDFLEKQFAEGEIMFIVDSRGIRIQDRSELLDADSADLD
jgi:hypothetical protein